ncbi:gliding motility-associated C-terminal domain-containing protein [Hyunsoonleella jejuensis]|uniref:Gliding motility-associated C-terminal domain-containing protein n=1 Tax=Hyunsoonleella jejuensis TaxID=419940 RepID=A0A1H9FY95_9FLAO|nr:PKD domain-containing protein [Hyunsoonleella jejuensis]SEQ42837.1 gliding motility-associated C-terminal domain-containing protein [Hyunsoonleella jejuensis]
MLKKSFLIALFSIVIIASLFALKDTSQKVQYLVNNELSILPPSASISGTTEVCLNSTPAPEITFTGSGGVAPYTFTYTINGGGNLTVSTAGSNNSVNLSVNTGTTGTFAYRLVSVEDITGDSEAASGTATVTIHELPIVDFNFTNDNTCSGTPVNFTTNISGASPFTYNWNFGDGTTSNNNNPTHVFDALGCGNQIFNVTLTVTDDNGCTASITKPITVQQKPLLDFRDVDSPFNPFNNCGNNTTDPSYTINVGIDNVSPCISSYDVDWGDGSPVETGVTFPATHTYTQLGSFNMEITGNGTNCNNTVTYLIKNSSNPTGAIVNPGNTVNLCTPVAPIEFAIGSWATNPPDTNYQVDFGDGTVENYTQAQLEASTYFNAADPVNSQDFPIPHTYTETSCPFSYTVFLFITTSCGQTNLTAGPIIILRKPEVDFEDPPISCVNTPVLFDNTSLNGYSNNCSINDGYFWDFGDGNTSNDRDPTHTYTTTGTFTVSLYAENSCGVTDTITKDICIEADLTAAFTLDTNNGCSPLDVQTTNTTDLSESCGGVTYLWEVTYASGFCSTGVAQWNFTNGTDENSANPSFEFISAGTYTLSLTTTNTCGSDMVSETIEVKQPPTVAIDAVADFCGTASINPTASVNTCAPATETVTYNWSFPGGTPATATTLNPGTIVYNTPGVYQISFSVTSSCGTTIDTEDFEIFQIPTLTNTDLTQTICSGTATTEVNLTSDITGTTFTWSATAPPGVTGFVTNGTTSTIPVQTIFNSNTTSEDVTYTITPSNGNCDGAPVNLVITVDPAPEFTSQPQSETICLNGSINQLSVSVNGPGTPSYQWYSNTANDTATGTAITGETNATYTPPNTPVGVTFYYVIASFTSGAGCNEITSNTARIEVVESIQIDTNPIPTQSICVGGSFATDLTITHSGGTGTITYQWYLNTTNSNTGGTAIPGETGISYTSAVYNTPGTFYYYVTVTASGSGCAPVTSEVAEIRVVDDPTITSQPIISQELCQGSTPQDLEIQVTGGLGTNYEFQWYSNTANANTGGTIITGATNAIFTPPTTAVGTLYYYAEITQPNPGCSVVSDVSEVIINQAPTITNQPISETICFGEAFNTLSVAFANGVGTPTFQWYSNTVNDTTTGTPIAGETGTTYTPPSGMVGTVYYYAIITFSSGGCTEITSIISEQTVNETPDISDKTDIICSGNAFTITPDSTGGDTAPTGTTYTWTSPVINPAGTITGASQETTPQLSISQTLTNTTTNPSTVTYTVTPNLGACIGTDFQVVITVNPSISITSIQTNSSCYLDNGGALDITISGGVPFSTGNPYQINWTGPNGYTNTSEDISNLAPGDYTVSILDDGGCPFSETFAITEPDELIFSTIDFDPETISCFQEDDGAIGIDVSGGTVPYTYSWTRNGAPYSTDEDLTNLPPGTYEITVTDANNCNPIIQSFSVIEPPELQATLNTQVDVICFGEATGEINVNITGGRPFEISPGVFDYAYNWTGPNGFASTNQNLTGLFAGTYNVTVTDRSNCTDTLEVIIDQTDEIIIDITATEIECYNDNDASITIDTISGGNGPYTIAWSNLGSGPVQNNLSPGTYVITVTDATDCIKEATVVIDAPPIFRITPEVTNVSCFGANDARIVLNLEGGIEPIDLNWDDDPTAGVERNNLGPGTYTVTITDGKPCVITETFVITEPAAVNISGTKTDALDCADANSGAINAIITGGTQPLTYSWSNGANTEDLNNIPPGDYTLTVTDANNCEISDTFTINRFEPLEVAVETDTSFDCDAKTVDQSFIAQPSGGVPPYQISWSSGTVSGANNEIMQTNVNGLVVIDVTDSIGCSISFSYNVAIPELGDPNFTLTSEAITNFGFYSIEDPIQFTNTSSGNYVGMSWDFGDGNFSSEENPIHTYKTVGTYIVTQTVIYPFDCVYTRTLTLNIQKGYSLIVPNAFTPNDDALNDYFLPSQIALSNMKFEIYDTWGSMVYSEEGESLRGWDGKIKGSNAENGNYYYTFSGDTFYGETITSKGVVVLIK